MEQHEKIKVALLTTEEVMSMLRVCKRTLQNYRTEGKLPYTAFSRKTYRYKVDDVVRFLLNSSSCSYSKDTLMKHIPDL